MVSDETIYFGGYLCDCGWEDLSFAEERESNLKEFWKHEDYRVYVIQQMVLYYAGMHTASRTAEILRIDIRDVWNLAKKLDNLY